MKEADSWTAEVWKSKKLHLSDAALAKVHPLFVNIDFRELPFDIRSAALREFLSPEIRRGLGIYLTPDAVSRMMVAIVSPDVHKLSIRPGVRLRDIPDRNAQILEFECSCSEELRAFWLGQKSTHVTYCQIELGASEEDRFSSLLIGLSLRPFGCGTGPMART